MKGGDCGLERISTCWFESKYFFFPFCPGISLFKYWMLGVSCFHLSNICKQILQNKNLITYILITWKLFTVILNIIYIYINFSSVFTSLGTAGFKIGLSKESLTIFQADIWNLRSLQLCWKEHVEKKYKYIIYITARQNQKFIWSSDRNNCQYGFL